MGTEAKEGRATPPVPSPHNARVSVLKENVTECRWENWDYNLGVRDPPLAERRVYPTQNPFCFKDSQIKEQNGPKQTEYYIIDIFQDNSYFKLASNMAAMCAATVCLTPERQVYKRQAG